MPEAIIEQELWKIFGSRSEYRKAPVADIQKHRIVLLARWKVENAEHAKREAELAKVQEKTGG